jgi:hypothetical protein
MELGINSGTLLVPPPSPLVFTEEPLLQMRVSFPGQLDCSPTSHLAPARSLVQPYRSRLAHPCHCH